MSKAWDQIERLAALKEEVARNQQIIDSLPEYKWYHYLGSFIGLFGFMMTLGAGCSINHNTTGDGTMAVVMFLVGILLAIVGKNLADPNCC